MRRTFNEPKSVIKKQTRKPLSEKQKTHMVNLQKDLQKFLASRSWAKMSKKPLRDSRGRFIKRVK